MLGTTYCERCTQGITSGPEPLKIQYKDYAAWHNKLLQDEEKTGKARAFWENYLSGTMPVLNLPYDRSGSLGSSGSAAYQWGIDEQLSESLRNLAITTHSSLFMILLAGFNLLLSQICGQKDILMAIPASARQHEALKNVMGMFVNTLVVRTSVESSQTFADFFRDFKEKLFQVLEYQHHPMELIFSQLKIKYPRIAVFFNMVNLGNSSPRDHSDFHPLHSEQVQDTKFDLHCYLTEYDGGIIISCHYFKNRFLAGTIEKIAHLYIKILENISAQPGIKIKAYDFKGKRKVLKHQE